MSDPLDDDALAAAVLRRLVDHLRRREDVSNIELMGRAGFCRNCLADWLAEAAAERGRPLGREEARQAIYAMPYEAWKAGQPPATPDQVALMHASLERNRQG